MMTSQILRSVHFAKSQKSRYFDNETLFLLQLRKSVNDTAKATLLQKIVL